MRNITDTPFSILHLFGKCLHTFSCRFVTLNLGREGEEEGKLRRERCWDLTEIGTSLFANGSCRGAAVMCYIVNYVSVEKCRSGEKGVSSNSSGVVDPRRNATLHKRGAQHLLVNCDM